MSDLKGLVAEIERDPNMFEELSTLEPQALVRWAEAKGYRLTLDQATSLSATYQELSDDDLEQVAGGWTNDSDDPPGP